MADTSDGGAVALTMRSPVILATPPRLQPQHRRTKATRSFSCRGSLRLADDANSNGVSPMNATALPVLDASSPTGATLKRPRSTGALGTTAAESRFPNPVPRAPRRKGYGRDAQSGSAPLLEEIGDASSEDSDVKEANLKENVRLRKRLHKQARELQDTKKQLEFTERELRLARSEVDDLRLKLSNLERIDRTKSAELLQERRKGDEMSKQVKAMSQNLLSIKGMTEGNDSASSQDASGLQKRCFKLVQQNTAITVQARLLKRQKDWAEAKARVLQNEVSQVYLGTHKQVKDDGELELATSREFEKRGSRGEEAKIYKLLLPAEYKHKETVVDFLTHISHTNGQDVHGFLQGSRVYSDGIRTECITGLGREFYAGWRLNRQLPHILRAVESLCHLRDYLHAFESFSAEIQDLLQCAHARIWVADHVQHCLWTCTREGETKRKTISMPLPKGRTSADLAGQGLVAAAFVSHKAINVADARKDPRYRPGPEWDDAADGGPAMSAICVPIVKQQKVRVVLQAVNKLLEPNFDPQDDTRVLRLLGKVSTEVLQVCQDNSAASKNAHRKEALLSLFTDQVPCCEPLQLLHALEHGLHDVFMSQACALHIPSAGADSTTRHQLTGTGMGGKKHIKHVCDGLKGLTGQVVRKKDQASFVVSKLEDSQYDPLVDMPLPADERGVLHTVPICSGPACLAVVQFICPEHDAAAVGDDGAYHPENTSHSRILSTLFTFVEKHLHVLMPRKGRTSNASGEGDHDDDRISAMAAAQAAAKDEHEEVERARVDSLNEGSEAEEEMTRAATLIQRHARGKAGRDKVRQLRDIARENQKRRMSTSKPPKRSGGGPEYSKPTQGTGGGEQKSAKQSRAARVSD